MQLMPFAAFGSTMQGFASFKVRRPRPLAFLLAFLSLHLLHPGVSGSAKCYTCDNYFELNFRNLDKVGKADVMKRYCSISSFLTDDNQADCSGIDFDGCVKIVTRSYRYHIDNLYQGGSVMRHPETLISTVVTRDCADIPPALGPGCHMLYGAGTTTEMCYCKGDYCNAAAGLRLHRPLLALLLLLLPLLAVPHAFMLRL